eukprot:TRINITY_DN2311_c0_g1_i2.p1 TRINITY_DN2311_c0_g1~~TRINITY_DN2311_c0_g1_i2.p1  ORF type:complete len:161 (-),score=9.53 TRINITY_DN2311_c0_g1_i2:76-558(-)
MGGYFDSEWRENVFKPIWVKPVPKPVRQTRCSNCGLLGHSRQNCKAEEEEEEDGSGEGEADAQSSSSSSSSDVSDCEDHDSDDQASDSSTSDDCGPDSDDADEPCVICGKTDDAAHSLLCDGCDKPYHMRCLRPPLHRVPKGDWFCPRCLLGPDAHVSLM